MKRTLNIIMFTDRIGEVRSYEINPQRAMRLGLLAFLVLAGALLYGGFRLGVQAETGGRLAEVTALQELTERQQSAIETAREHARDNLDALTLRLGRMQAQMLRLDALGERLVGQADLDAAEFDFSSSPPVAVTMCFAVSIETPLVRGDRPPISQSTAPTFSTASLLGSLSATSTC